MRVVKDEKPQASCYTCGLFRVRAEYSVFKVQNLGALQDYNDTCITTLVLIDNAIRKIKTRAC